MIKLTHNVAIMNLQHDIAFGSGRLKRDRKLYPSLELIALNKVKTVQASLALEGNLLTLDQMLELSNCKDVIASEQDIYQAKNALYIYDKINEINPLDIRHILCVYEILVNGLTCEFSNLAFEDFEINKSYLSDESFKSLNNLFDFIGKEEHFWLKMACMVHYEMLAIAVFPEKNGFIARLWQKLLLIKHNSVFEYITIDTVIKDRKDEYYKAFHESEKEMAPFVEFCLSAILQAMKDYSKTPGLRNDSLFRLKTFEVRFENQWFVRKDYRSLNRRISESTSSKDLRYGVEKSLLIHEGKHNQVRYKFL